MEITATVKNMGNVDGDEVLQVYVGSENTEEDRPVKLLKGFKRVSVKTGETAEVKISVDYDDIKFYDVQSGNWKLDKNYTVYIGTSSRNIVFKESVDL